MGSASVTRNSNIMGSHPVWEWTDSPLFSCSPHPWAARCGRLASGWAWDAVRRWPGDECATSRPGRCSSILSPRQCSHAPPRGSPCSQQNSWDLRRNESKEVAHINLTFDAVLWILMGKHTPVSALPILQWSQLIQSLTRPPSTHEYDVRWIWPFDPNPREEASYTSASYSDERISFLTNLWWDAQVVL